MTVKRMDIPSLSRRPNRVFRGQRFPTYMVDLLRIDGCSFGLDHNPKKAKNVFTYEGRYSGNPQ